MNAMKKTRVLIAKPGLDGHDVGAKIVVRALLEAGFDVIYTGLKQSPQDIVRRVCDDNVDVLGLSILSGSHIPICQHVKTLLEESGRQGILWVVGGSIPERDHEALKMLGVDAVFGVRTSPQSVVEFLCEKFHERHTDRPGP